MMPRKKVIIDCDPGIDDAVALCLALFEPRLDVVAITATEGNVSAQQSSRNVQAIIDQLDPPRLPRLGTASPADQAPMIDSGRMHGSDGLGNSGFAVSQLHHQHPSEKIIIDAVRAAPEQVTIVALGPLTNIARAFQRDPALPTLVNRIVMMGGSVEGIGTATASAEFNMYYDPISARDVFRSPTTKTLIPLDVTRQVTFSMNLLKELPSETSRIGDFLHKILRYSFRAYHQCLGQESIYLHDVVALLAAIHGDLFETEEMAGDVETSGELTSGATIFDRRPNRQWLPNMEVAVGVDAAAIGDCLVRGLRNAEKRS